MLAPTISSFADLASAGGDSVEHMDVTVAVAPVFGDIDAVFDPWYVCLAGFEEARAVLF